MTQLKDYYAAETAKMLSAFKQFSMLLPNPNRSGAAHVAEEGRFVEAILRSTLAKHLPNSVEVLTGFILHPHKRLQSSQLDILVFDSRRYPKYEHFEHTVVVPKEGVLAVISVKKTLDKGDVVSECTALRMAGNICGAKEEKHSPFLALVGFDTEIECADKSTVFERIEDAYPLFQEPYSNNELIDLITVLQSPKGHGWSIRKKHDYERPGANVKVQQRDAATGKIYLTKAVARTEADYLYFRHGATEKDLALQFLLHGILKVFYGRSDIQGETPDKTLFRSYRPATKARIGFLTYNGENRHFLPRGEDPLLDDLKKAAPYLNEFLRTFVDGPYILPEVLSELDIEKFTASAKRRLMPSDVIDKKISIDFGKARRVAKTCAIPELAFVELLYVLRVAKRMAQSLSGPARSAAADLWKQAAKGKSSAGKRMEHLAEAIDAACTVFALAATRRYASSKLMSIAAVRSAPASVALVPSASVLATVSPISVVTTALAPSHATCSTLAPTSTTVATTVATVISKTPTLLPLWDAHVVTTSYFKRELDAYRVSNISPARLLSELAILLDRHDFADAATLASEIRNLLERDLR